MSQTTKKRSGHTPGPWVAVTWDDNSSAQHDVTICCGPNDNRLKVATCHYLSYGDTAIDPTANAALIAAAPEMLEALERAMAWMDPLSEKCGDDSEAAIIDQANEAIAKARGES